MAKWSDIDPESLHPESLMMTYGFRPEWSEGAASPPIFQTSTFVFPSAQVGARCFEIAYGLDEAKPDEQPDLIYSRLNNPGLEIAEDRLALWDRADTAALFSSGMAAITTTLFAHLRPGEVVAASSPVYGGTHHFIEKVLPQYDIGFVRFDHRTTAEQIIGLVEATGKRLGMIYVETPANPTNELIDLQMCAAVAAHCSTPGHKVPLAVDNTFLGPVFQHPLEHGADIVVYSATKYLGGHGDLIAGAALGAHAMIDPVRAMRTFVGNMTNPFTAWLLTRSMTTLQLRMERQAANARRIADFLRDHPKVKSVNYLGHLATGDPHHDLFKRQCLGAGGMISFEIAGGKEAAYRFLDGLHLFKLAVSLGSVDSLAEHPATMTHCEAGEEVNTAKGITPGLVRLSIGVEHPDDLVADVGRALDQA